VVRARRGSGRREGSDGDDGDLDRFQRKERKMTGARRWHRGASGDDKRIDSLRDLDNQEVKEMRW
jgi:hypothetical protein